MAVLSPVAKQQFFLADGSTPAAGGLLYTYAANSTTPQATYTNRAGTVANANPIVLDAAGRATIYLDPALTYDYVLKTAAGVTVWTQEDVVSAGSNAADIGFTQSGTGAVARTMQDKARDIVSAKDFGAIANGVTNDTAALAKAITKAQGGTLYLPDGTYVNDSIPANINGVHIIGSPRVNFIGTPLPMFMGVFTGNRECCLVGGVIRYYATGPNGAGWYFLKDQGANHDPVLLGPVTASGTGSVILEMGVADFGLDPDEWTPAGFVCGPDETLAQSGCIFGASVGSDTIQIKGTYGNARTAYIRYDGSAWAVTNGAYTFAWTSGASAKLTVTRNALSSRSAYPTNGSTYPMVVPRRGASDPLIHVAVDTASKTSFEVRFYQADGTPILTESTDLKFYVMDPVAAPTPFSFSTAPDTASANIWMVGVFGRMGTTY